ncbi:MAG: hypothetical protein FWB85_10770, partial [Chitinispirillia bacterium]|nr:hypothetical protein [Chitinispirillia bacterium]MCL2242663.1 hypothetical protein [Chitinispirillia bacterium]
VIYMMTGPVTSEEMKEYWQQEIREEVREEVLAEGMEKGMAQALASLIQKGFPPEEAKRLLGIN